MKRFVIFAVFGPPLGWAALICRDRILATGMPVGTVSDAGWMYVNYMPLAYVFGMLPALATAGVDLKLSARFYGCKRVLGTTVFGFLVTYVFWLFAVPSKLSAVQF